MGNKIFDLHFFHDMNPSRPLINKHKYFRIQFRYSVTKFENFDSSVCMTPWSQNFKFSKSTFYTFILFSLMIDVFAPKRISPDCPFKSNWRLTNISILTLQCAIWLRGVMHTTELDSAVGCTPRTVLSNFNHWTLRCDAHWGATPQSLTPRCDTHREAWLHSGKHTAECFEQFWSLDSMVGC